jgi:8-oxo-dGTP diphosphatase
VPVLSDFDPRRLVSSPYVRCVDTLEPLAAAIDLEVETNDALAEGSVEDAVRLVRGSVSEAAVLCSHGDVIPAVLEQLVREDGMDIGPNPRNEKASVWVLRTKRRRFTRAEYIRPPLA